MYWSLVQSVESSKCIAPLDRKHKIKIATGKRFMKAPTVILIQKYFNDKKPWLYA